MIPEFRMSPTKRIGIVLLQLSVTAAGLFYVFHSARIREQAIETLQHSHWTWLLIGWCCYGMVEILATLRWQILLRIQGIGLSCPRAWTIVVIGLFFNMFLPGLIGGDAVRLYLIFKQATRKKMPATLSVVMDRLLGLCSILFLGAVAILLRFGWLTQFPETRHLTYLAAAILGTCVAAVGLLFGLVILVPQSRLANRLPFRKSIEQAVVALKIYRNRPLQIGLSFVITLASHFAYYLAFYSAMRSLEAGEVHRLSHIVDFVSLMPLVNTIVGVPISFGGAGVREALFQTLLGQLMHVPASLAALTASLGFLIQASWGIVGAAAYLLIFSSWRNHN